MYESTSRRIVPFVVILLIGAARAECQEWKTKWDKVLADGKKEGKVAVAGHQAPPIARSCEDSKKSIPRSRSSFRVLRRLTLPHDFPKSVRRDNIFGIST